MGRTKGSPRQQFRVEPEMLDHVYTRNQGSKAVAMYLLKGRNLLLQYLGEGHFLFAVVPCALIVLLELLHLRVPQSSHTIRPPLKPAHALRKVWAVHVHARAWPSGRARRPGGWSPFV